MQQKGWVRMGQIRMGHNGVGWQGMGQDGMHWTRWDRWHRTGMHQNRRVGSGQDKGPNQHPKPGDPHWAGVPTPLPAPRSPQAYTAAVPPPGPGRLLKAGAAVLIAGALLLLAGAIGAFYFWKATERQVSTETQ